ncbi:unnamed protein product [Bursaphelenchus xylophilus]|uniref:(pine wood nematode) hypothetical protein n=1 Tax=Bursaphelenchus xylophilus TaxID=6326 RepID=A0A7I8X8P6_BURXY|nr:unnamed protein product [Bursaphelenchus xylophilus]CAG9126239.1 unnamed protein product [Bursaphelenchus xylophilus]
MEPTRGICAKSLVDMEDELHKIEELINSPDEFLHSPILLETTQFPLRFKVLFILSAATLSMSYTLRKLLLFATLLLAIDKCCCLQCHEDVINGEGFELIECEDGTDYCAKLINDKGVKGSEEYRACATPKMCQTEGHFTLVFYKGLHLHCCKEEGCNSSTSTVLSLSSLVAAILLYRLL